MSYISAGAILMSDLQAGRTLVDPTVATTDRVAADAVQREQSKCSPGQVYNTTVNRCVPACPEGQVYNLYTGNCISGKIACDTGRDQVFDPKTGKCFDPQTMRVPWDLMQITPGYKGWKSVPRSSRNRARGSVISLNWVKTSTRSRFS